MLRLTQRLDADCRFLFQKFSGKAAGELGWLVWSQALSTLLGIATIKILATLGPGDYGVYALAQTISVLLSITLFGPGEQSFLRFYYDFAAAGTANVYISLGARILLFLSSGLVALVLVVSVIPTWSWIGLAPSLILAAGTFAVIMAATAPLSSLMNLLRRRKENTFYLAIERGVTVGLLAALLGLGQLTAERAMLVMGGVAAAVAIGRGVVLRSVATDIATTTTADREIQRQMLAKIWKFGYPFAIWGIPGWLQINSDRWAILAMSSATEVGRFTILSVIANFLIAIPYGVLAQLFTPVVYQRLAPGTQEPIVSEGDRFIHLFVSLMIVLTVLSIGVTAVFGKDLIVLISSEEFQNYASLLPAISLGIGLFYVGQALSLKGMALQLPSKYIAAKVATGFLAVSGNIIGAYFFGVRGVALSSCLIGVLYVVWIARINRRIASSVTGIVVHRL
jgi:O-antigen/teichoic acid export membrane protein